MASGDGTSDGLGREEHTRTKSLGKATLEENETNAALESLSGPQKSENPKIPSTRDVAQDLAPFSKGKQVVLDSKYGHDSMDPSEQSSTSKPTRSFQGEPGIFPSSDEERMIPLGPSSSSKKRPIQALQETDTQTDGPNPTQLNLGGVAASVAPVHSTGVEPNGGSIVVHHGKASLEPNGGALVLNDVNRAESFVQPMVVDLHGVAPPQSNVAPPGEVLAQPNIALNLTPPAPIGLALAQPNAALIVVPPNEVRAQPNIVPNVAPRAHGVAPVQPDVAPHAQRNDAPLAPAQPNVALIVAPPVGVLNVNCGLNHSQLKPLQICEIGSEGHFWPKLPRN